RRPAVNGAATRHFSGRVARVGRDRAGGAPRPPCPRVDACGSPAPRSAPPTGGRMTQTVAADLQQLAKDHLWMHFTAMSGYRDGQVPVIVRRDGWYDEVAH